MERIGVRREKHAGSVRALRWRLVAVATLLVSACARWSLPGGPMADPRSPDADAKLGGSGMPTAIATTRQQRIDDLRAQGHASSERVVSSRIGARSHIARPRPGAAPAQRGSEEAHHRLARDDESLAASRIAVDTASSPAIIGGSASADAAPGAAMSSGMAASAPAEEEISNAVLHPVVSAVIAVPPVEAGEFQESNQQSWRWLAGLAAALLLFLIARRRTRPRRVRKMNMQRAELTGPRLPLPTKAHEAEKARVRMFSALEIYAPTHESHRGPWEAPVTTERGFAHRYQVGAQVGDGLLFVPESEVDTINTHCSLQREEPVADPAAFAAPLTTPMPAPSVTPTSAVPLVFSMVAKAPVQACAQGVSFDEHVSDMPGIRETSPAASPERAGPAITKASAMQRHAPDTQCVATTTTAGPSEPAEARAKQASPVLEETVAPSGAMLLDTAELFSNVTRAPAARAPDARPAPSLPTMPTMPPMDTVSDAARRDSIAEARRLVEAGDHPAALKHLEMAMQSPHPTEEIWMLAALCWWQVARADGSPKAYANAADAMDRLLELDPSQLELWYRTGSCRLLQASGERGAAQRATLDLAVAALRRATAEDGRGDPLRSEALGDALFERALAATDERAVARAQRMADAVQVLRDAARSVRDPASSAAWKLQQALQAQASLLAGNEASRLRMEADAVLASGVDRAGAQERVAWVAAKVENELAHAELAEGATRALHLRTFRENHRDLLTGPDSSPELLLSWLALLALETAHLRGDAARSRFDEGEAILKRLDDLLPNNAHVSLARARILHRRAMQSGGSVRHALLSDAIAGLMPMVERGDVPHLQVEVAELLLDRAAGVPTAQAADEFARAEAMASGLFEHSEFAMAAARCALQARLGHSSTPVEASVCRRLETLAGDDVRSRRLLAQAALRNGAPREACGHCEAAARSGERLGQAFMQLWDQASRQWGATLHNPRDPAWLANRQCLRTAG